jgi:uncharacterized damage-inducible protein DinB
MDRKRQSSQERTARAELSGSLIEAWRTNQRATSYLVERLPETVWGADVPGVSRRPVRMIAAHLHNCRSRWIRTLGQEHGIKAPGLVDLRRVSRRELLSALRKSGKGIEDLLALGVSAGGSVPPSRAYVWRNLPLDVGHVLTYFVAHEAHHRGQLVMIARQLGYRLPPEVVNGLWQWSTFVRERLRPGIRVTRGGR